MSSIVKPTWNWIQCEGAIVDDQFRLLSYLGAGRRSAVFLTERIGREPSKAAIKLVLADGTAAEQRLSRWRACAQLSHPRLIQLFEMGRATLDDVPVAYLVMEYAEEELSQVDRPLTQLESTEMLGATVEALTYLHGKGFAHGHLKPSNVLAVEDRLRLSSDTIRVANSPPLHDAGDRDAYDAPELTTHKGSLASDIWSLGVTLVQATTNRLPALRDGAAAASLPENLPAQFRELASNCLVRDPGRRWTVAEIARFLAALNEPPAPATRSSRSYLLPAGVVLLAAVVAIIGLRFMNHPAAPTPPDPEPAVSRQEPAAPVSRDKTPSAAPTNRIEQVLPSISPEARNSIRGKVTINIRVVVNPAGEVISAVNESKSNRYFGNLALQAARKWKFPQADPGASRGPRQWVLRFQFVRDAAQPVSVVVKPAENVAAPRASP